MIQTRLEQMWRDMFKSRTYDYDIEERISLIIRRHDLLLEKDEF